MFSYTRLAPGAVTQRTPLAPSPTHAPTTDARSQVAARPTAEMKATITPSPSPTATPSDDFADCVAEFGYCWGVLGNDGQRLAEEYAAGIRLKHFRVGWRSFEPEEGRIDQGYVDEKRAELAALHQAGFHVLLSISLHDTPVWLHDRYRDSHYINQYGEKYEGDFDGGDANLIFNADIRAAAARHVADVFEALGTNFAAVRLGAARYGELTYPPAEWNGHTNLYWNYDANALRQMPVQGWRPGDPSPDGEAARFLDWHLNALVDLQDWLTEIVRKHYDGPLMLLYPSWGIRPGNVLEAVAGNLDGSSSAERNGEIQRGFDFARQIAAIDDPNVIVSSTWLDADASGDSRSNPARWSPVRYVAHLAAAHPLKPPVFGENTGHGSRAEMELSAAQMARYGLRGLLWFNEDELFSGKYATLDDYRDVIEQYSK